jgi:iron complex transport system permease protein
MMERTNTQPVTTKTFPRAGILPAVLLGGIIVLVLSVSFAVSVGSIAIPTSTVWGVVVNKIAPDTIETAWSRGREAIVWQIRLPRVLLACFVGAGLSLVGASLQSVTRNPLADPHLLGISSGGAFGAILALMHTGLFLGGLTVPLFAFLGSLVATAMVLGVVQFTRSTSADRMILAGVAVSFIVMSAANVLVFLGDPKATNTVVFWMLGGLGLAQWSNLIYPLTVLVGCASYFWLKSGELNAMTVGDETASTLGIPVTRLRIKIFAAGALLTGVMVAFSGIIGFVGLMVPHIVRMLVGGDYARILPVSALLGAIFLVWADIAARTVLAPEDIPIGIVTGLIGGGFFLWLLGRKNS